MSSNLAVINFSVGGTLSVTGKVTLSESVKSSNLGEFQGIQTTTLSVSSTSTFNGSLPTSNMTPTLDNEFTTKIYVDTADLFLNTRITDTDAAQKTYIDDADSVLNTRITDTDSAQKTYIDDADSVLNTRITDTDSAQKTYIDDADNLLNTRITDTDSSQKTYIDNLFIRKPYYIQNAARTYVSTELGISQFIEFGVSIGNNDATYSTILPNPNTCSGQIIYLWNNSTGSQGVGQTGNNKFIKAVANLPSFFIPINETYMLISKGNAWVVYVFHKP
jgi:hypothetical protein